MHYFFLSQITLYESIQGSQWLNIQSLMEYFRIIFGHKNTVFHTRGYSHVSSAEVINFSQNSTSIPNRSSCKL
jgi:hypothetical protein